MSEVQYKNIKKNFGSVEVLKDINLKIDNQKFVVLFQDHYLNKPNF